jgi:HD superfamily phosphohydrolase
LPFSHAAEKELLAAGESHESLSLQLIRSDYLKPIWKTGFRVQVDDVAKLALGQKKLRDENIDFDDWEAVLSEIIAGDALGVDRMDYLLRDSYHLGVPYGRFDHNKLIESLRILPKSLEPGESREPSLGVEEGGLHSAEALLLARYFMYEQVYFHNVRKIYDRHLVEFMKAYYKPRGGYLRNLEFHLDQTDSEILSAIRSRATDPRADGHEPAKAIANSATF